MSDRSQQIKVLKHVFKTAKHAPRDEESHIEDLQLHWELGCAIIEVGQEKFYELKNEVYSYLKDPFSEFRAEAVRTLGWDTRLQIEEFCRDEAYKIWLEDADEEVKTAALTAWAGYYSRTHDPKILKILYNIFTTQAYSNEIRAHALKSFFDVCDGLKEPQEGYYLLELGDIEENEEFNLLIDWNRVNDIMNQYVPNWKN